MAFIMALLGALAASPKIIAAISAIIGVISGIIGTIAVNSKKNAVNAAAEKSAATKDTTPIEDKFGGKS